jgi:hypothetical protein
MGPFEASRKKGAPVRHPHRSVEYHCHSYLDGISSSFTYSTLNDAAVTPRARLRPMPADIVYLFVCRAAPLAALVAALWSAPPSAQSATPLEVVLDQATIATIPNRSATVVVGNPLIADVYVPCAQRDAHCEALEIHGGQTMVVTGKGYGVTNVIALDRAGKPIAELLVRVRSPADSVVVYRGIARESYSCTPYCERRLTLGDDPAYFDPTIAQIGNRNARAQTSETVAGGDQH